MKTRSIIITAAALLALSTEAPAQKKIKEAFAEIEKYDGVTTVSEQNTSKCIDTLGISCESSIVTLLVKKNYYHAVFDKLKKAFESEGKNASVIEIEDAGETPNVDPITAQMLGRKQWSVWREGAEPVLVGGMGNSCYRIAIFNDKKHPDFRTCCAAEWTGSVNPDVYKAQIVYVYGRKPENSQPLQYSGSVTWPRKKDNNFFGAVPMPNALREQMNDTVFVISGNRQPGFDHAFSYTRPNIAKPQDIPLDGDLPTWMNKAMNNVKHLSNSDWHRMFGLLTQQMMDKAEKKSMDDLVVAAGIVLDLCKNADQLDNDEREISARRLEDVATHYFDGDKHLYIHDLLMLGAKKLRK